MADSYEKQLADAKKYWPHSDPSEALRRNFLLQNSAGRVAILQELEKLAGEWNGSGESLRPTRSGAKALAEKRRLYELHLKLERVRR